MKTFKGALKRRFQTPLDLNLLLFRLSRACKWAIRSTLDSHILITLDFFNMLLRPAAGFIYFTAYPDNHARVAP